MFVARLLVLTALLLASSTQIIIAMTALAMTSDKQRCLQGGMNGDHRVELHLLALRRCSSHAPLLLCRLCIKAHLV
jgi:CheY-like chemotaxis protein